MIADLARMLGFSALASAGALLVVLLLRRPMRRRFGAQAAYALWTLVPATALVALLPARVVNVEIETAAAAATAAPALAPAVAASAIAPDPLPWVAAIWLIGACSAFVLLVREQRRFVRALGRLLPLDTDVVRAESSAGCPALVGAWRPRIVLPADFETRYDAAERALILAHERTHRARGDAQINALAALLRCLYWFNPLVHIAASRFRFDQELACDAAVIARFPEARRSYADAMLKTQLADLGLPAGCHWQSSHPLKERISMLKHPLPGRARAALGLGLAAVLVTGGGYVAWAAQPPNEVKSMPMPVAGSADRPATYRKISRLDYPSDGTQQVACVAIATFAVDASGNITNLLALTKHGRGAPESCKVEKAVATIMAKPWTFEPAVSKGKPVASKVIVPIVFTPHPDDPFDSSAIPPEALDAIRVSPPQPEKSASLDQHTMEDVVYRPIHTPPKYPPEAIAARQQGKLVFKVLVDEHGAPESVDLYSSEPPEVAAVFSAPSIEAIRTWRFNPATKDGKPQAGYVMVPIDFTLTDVD